MMKCKMIGKAHMNQMLHVCLIRLAVIYIRRSVGRSGLHVWTWKHVHWMTSASFACNIPYCHVAIRAYVQLQMRRPAGDTRKEKQFAEGLTYTAHTFHNA